MAMIIGQLERLINSELQKLYAKEKVGKKSTHLERLRNQHEQARGNHHGRSGRR